MELLVALALMGIVFVLLTSWQASTLDLSTRTAALSHSLAELNDTSGYLGDRIRAAVRVRVATAGLSVNSLSCTNDHPCLALVVPDHSSGGTLARYHLHVYRLEIRSRVAPADKVADPWAEANVQVLREYRSTDPFGGSGSTPRDCVGSPAQLLASPPMIGSGAPAYPPNNLASCQALLNLNAATSLAGMQPYLVADYLTPAGNLGDAPFAYSPADRTVTLRFQYRQRVRGREMRTPDSPYTLTVQARNLP